jgi:hypothetical protein
MLELKIQEDKDILEILEQIEESGQADCSQREAGARLGQSLSDLLARSKAALQALGPETPLLAQASPLLEQLARALQDWRALPEE